MIPAAAWAAGADPAESGWIVWGFFAVCALIAVRQVWLALRQVGRAARELSSPSREGEDEKEDRMKF
ncbi:MAG: hypothetical protein RBT64_11635 [Trichloromonas sp.]|nr:hypothetical protein [Trichloromonas sp.]